MPAYQLIPARRKTAFDLASQMRGADVRELLAGTNHSPLTALLDALDVSLEAWEGWIGDDLLCMFGVGNIDYASGSGSPWMLGTDMIDEYFLTFAKVSQLWIADVRARYGHLHNFVDARNTASLRWLEWLGFRICEEAPHGPHGLPFRRVELEGDACAIRPQ